MEFNATFLISVISFVLFVIIMNFIFYKPLAKIIYERKNFIDENFDEAKKNNANAQKITEAYYKKINEANSESKAVMETKTQEAKAKRDELILESQKQFSEEILNSQNELKQAFEGSKEVLKTEVVNLTNKMAEKLLGKNAVLNNSDNELINKIMNEG